MARKKNLAENYVELWKRTIN